MTLNLILMVNTTISVTQVEIHMWKLVIKRCLILDYLEDKLWLINILSNTIYKKKNNGLNLLKLSKVKEMWGLQRNIANKSCEINSWYLKTRSGYLHIWRQSSEAKVKGSYTPLLWSGYRPFIWFVTSVRGCRYSQIFVHSH